MQIASLPQLILDILFLARAAEGEGCLLMAQPQECTTWLVHSVLNRTEKPWWSPSVRKQIEQFYHGHRRIVVPSEQAISMALLALFYEERAHPYFFMVSQKDYQDHPEWDKNLIQKSFWNERKTAALHFLSGWPESK